MNDGYLREEKGHHLFFMYLLINKWYYTIISWMNHNTYLTKEVYFGLEMLSNQSRLPTRWNRCALRISNFTQDPFDFIDPDIPITTDDCSFSSDTTAPHVNTGAGRVSPSPLILFSGAGMLTDKIDVSMQPHLSAASRSSECNHLHTIMSNACMISHQFWKEYLYKPNEVFRALIDSGAWVSTTCHKELIRDLTKFMKSFPSPVWHTGVINEENGVSQSIVPDSGGYIFVPSCFSQHG